MPTSRLVDSERLDALEILKELESSLLFEAIALYFQSHKDRSDVETVSRADQAFQQAKFVAELKLVLIQQLLAERQLEAAKGTPAPSG